MTDDAASTRTDPRVTLADGALTATFLPALGMVVCSVRHEGAELLDLRGGPEAYANRGSTFGIPLLYPYANRLSGWEYAGVQLDPSSPLVHVDGATGLPMHGLLAASRYWEVTDQAAARLKAELDFAAHPDLLALFPFGHRLTYAAHVGGGRLTIALTVTATGDRPVPISFGFHPYLRCDRRDATIELPVRRRARLDDRGLPTGEHDELVPGELDGPLGERTFDDCFDELVDPPAFRVASRRRTISIELVRGWRVAQVYAPEGSHFICFEPMTAPVDALRSGDGLRHVAPGDAFTAEFAVVVTS
jgi:galactose mutarotase-like enzyme